MFIGRNGRQLFRVKKGIEAVASIGYFIILPVTVFNFTVMFERKWFDKFVLASKFLFFGFVLATLPYHSFPLFTIFHFLSHIIVNPIQKLQKRKSNRLD